MIPKLNNHVKLLLRNNVIVEGFVKEWGECITILALDKSSYNIINNINDIVVTKIILTNEIKPSTKQTNINKSELEEKFEEIQKEPANELRDKSLAELKILMANQDRQIIANKLKDHHVGDITKVKYQPPNFFKK